jgi:hypothetical protein
MTLDEAVTLLKKAVKYSEVKNQKHIDLTLVSAVERPLYQRALIVANLEVQKGTLTQGALTVRLGLESKLKKEH